MDRLFIKLNNVPRNEQLPTIVLSLTAYRKVSLWTKLAADINNWEVSGLGTILAKHGGLFVSDVWLIKPSRVGGAHVEQDPAAINALMRKLYTGGRDIKNLRFLWHSHANFGVGWSGTDDQTAREDFCPDAPWTVNLVTNAQGQFLARQDFPKTRDDPKNNLPVRLLIPITAGLSRKYREQYNHDHEQHMAKYEANRKAANVENVNDLYNTLDDLEDDFQPVEGDELGGKVPLKPQLLLPPPPSYTTRS